MVYSIYIPNYENTVREFVSRLKIRWLFLEHALFSTPVKLTRSQSKGVRIHVGDGGVSMKQAMDPNIKELSKSRWIKLNGNV